MTNLIKSSMKSKSLALKNDAHLLSIASAIDIVGDDIVINNYKYLDYEVVQSGAVFFFVLFEKWVNDSWDNVKDCKEVYSEFEEQRLYRTEYDFDRGIIQGERYKVIDNFHESFDLDSALQEAELKAILYINSLK